MPRGKFERTQEHKKNISDALKKSWTPERRAKAAEVRGEQHPNFGKRRSEESIEKQRQWMLEHAPNRGRELSPETKAKLSDIRLGKAYSLRKYGVSPEEYAFQVSTGNRWCFFRKHFMPIAKFTNRSGCCNDCKSDHYRKGDLAKKYSLTHEQYEAILLAQGGGCAICGSTDPGPRNKNMHIDHNHATGAVRGILCGPCNTALERLETIKNWGLLASQYLLK